LAEVHNQNVAKAKLAIEIVKTMRKSDIEELLQHLNNKGKDMLSENLINIIKEHNPREVTKKCLQLRNLNPIVLKSCKDTFTIEELKGGTQTYIKSIYPLLDEESKKIADFFLPNRSKQAIAYLKSLKDKSRVIEFFKDHYSNSYYIPSKTLVLLDQNYLLYSLFGEDIIMDYGLFRKLQSKKVNLIHYFDYIPIEKILEAYSFSLSTSYLSFFSTEWKKWVDKNKVEITKLAITGNDSAISVLKSVKEEK